MRRRRFPALLVLALLALLWSSTLPAGTGVRAASLVQLTPFLTPTPGSDGRIVYTVQQGDTPWRIAAIAGITVEELMSRNGLQADDFISPGMQLELGLAGPVLPTLPAGVQPTATEIPLTPTPVTGTGEICVLLFLDENGDARLQEGELPLAEGKVSVADVSGIVAGERTTDTDPEGFCFTELINGNYNVSAAVPPDYNPTTSMNVPVSLYPGDIKFVQFGAQASSIRQDAAGTGDTRSTLLGVLGLILLAAGVGLGYYASRFRKRVPRSLR